MDYNKFMNIVNQYGDYVREYGYHTSDIGKWYKLMIEKYKEICEIAVKLDFSHIKD